MKGTIIYIHGFRSDGASSKPKKIAKTLPDYKIITDSFSANPTEVIQQLEKIMSDVSGPVYFMGTSLGGFYSMYMAVKTGHKCFCINPSLLSHETIKRKTGKYKTYNLELDYDFKADYIDTIQGMHDELFKVLKNKQNEFVPNVFFNEDDDVIHHSLFEDYKPLFNLKYYPDGGHRATNIQAIMKDIIPQLNDATLV